MQFEPVNCFREICIKYISISIGIISEKKGGGGGCIIHNHIEIISEKKEGGGGMGGILSN